MSSRSSSVAARLAVAAITAALVGGCALQSNATPAPLASAAATVTVTAAPNASASATATLTPESLPQGGEPVLLDPADFVATITNPYWPMTVGSRWIYHETDAEGTVQQVEVTVIDATKQILGISATVVHDVVTEDGEVVEDTYDWYAQDTSGNLWYLGEDTREYEAGKVVSTAGSWEAGADGAQPGIILPGQPQVDMAYRQEYHAGDAEDTARILSLAEHADVPYGSFDELLMTEETTPLDPGLRERKYYARGIGQVLAVDIAGGSSREELVSYVPGGAI